MSVDAPPPSLPPQMSPDGKWIWDGAQWRPIPVHEAAFPNWKDVGSGFAPETDLRAQPAPLAAPAGKKAAAAAPLYRLAGPAPGLAVPRWNTGSARASVGKYASMAAVAGALVVVIVTVSVIATLFLTRPSPPAASVTITTQATGPTARSDSAWAAYVIKTLDPSMSDLKDALALVLQSCGVGMTSACEDSLISVENKVSPMLPILDKATIPLCIAAHGTVFRADLGKIVEGEQIGLKGFNDNKYKEWLTGYAQVNAYGVRAMNGFASIKSDATSCDSALKGP